MECKDFKRLFVTKLKFKIEGNILYSTNKKTVNVRQQETIINL